MKPDGGDTALARPLIDQNGKFDNPWSTWEVLNSIICARINIFYANMQFECVRSKGWFRIISAKVSSNIIHKFRRATQLSGT